MGSFLWTIAVTMAARKFPLQILKILIQARLLQRRPGTFRKKMKMKKKLARPIRTKMGVSRFLDHTPDPCWIA
jgi:hypothetical protein